MSTVYSVGMMPEWEMTVLMKSWCFCEKQNMVVRWPNSETFCSWVEELALGSMEWSSVSLVWDVIPLDATLWANLPAIYSQRDKVLGPSQTEWEPWRVLMLNIFGRIMVDCSLLWLQCSFRYNHGILCLLLLSLVSGLLLEVFIRSHWGRCSCGNLTPSWWEWGWFLGGWSWGS